MGIVRSTHEPAHATRHESVTQQAVAADGRSVDRRSDDSPWAASRGFGRSSCTPASSNSITRAAQMDIAFDNSALCNVLGVEAREAALVEHIHSQAQNGRLLVSLDALGECLSQNNLDSVLPRARAIGRLFGILGSAAALTPGAMELIQEFEWRPPPTTRTPTLAPWQQRDIFSHLTSSCFLETHRPVAARLRAGLRKDAADVKDKNAKTAFVRLLPTQPRQEELAACMETFPQRVLAPGAHFMKLVSRSARHRRRIRGEPAAFRAAVTLVAYSELNALGSLFASVGYGQYHSVLRASRRGEWVDACIAAASSYAGL